MESLLNDVSTSVDALAKLPHIAVWLALFFLIYKLSIMASVYGVVGFVAQKMHDAYVHKKASPPEKFEDITPMLDGLLIQGEKEHFLAQLRRIAGKGVSIETKYIHHASVEWLREAIDDKLAKESANEKEKIQKLKTS